jgi:hypothetical protein
MMHAYFQIAGFGNALLKRFFVETFTRNHLDSFTTLEYIIFNLFVSFILAAGSSFPAR